MLKKISKKLIIFSSLFLTFFCFQNVNATTIYFEDDFDDYVVSDPLSGYSNWSTPSWTTSPTISSDYYVSAGNSVKFSNNGKYVYYNFNGSLDSFYVSADVLLDIPYPEGQNEFTFGGTDSDENIFNLVFFRCVKTYDSLYGQVSGISGAFSTNNEVVNQLCNGAFNNISVLFERDYVNNRTIISPYINGDLLGTFYCQFSNSGFYYAYFNSDDIYLDNFIISDSLPSTPSAINGSCGSDADTYSYYNDPPTNLCSTGTSDNFTFNGLAYQSGSAWTWDCVGENDGTSASCTAYLDPNSKIDGVCGDYANQDFQTVEDFNGFSPYNTYHKCSQGLYNSTSFVASVNTVSWYCTGINYGISAFCTANLITPTTDAFDYNDYEIPDFYEDLTDKGWFVQAMAWLFLPTAETLNDHNNIFHEFRGKAPLGYVAKFHDFFMSIVSESPEPIPFPDLVITPFAGTEPVTLFNYVYFVETVGADNFSRFYHFLELLIGAVVIGYLVKRGIGFVKELK